MLVVGCSGIKLLTAHPKEGKQVVQQYFSSLSTKKAGLKAPHSLADDVHSD